MLRAYTTVPENTEPTFRGGDYTKLFFETKTLSSKVRALKKTQATGNTESL